MQTFSTIIPIFAIILMGWIARKKGYLHADFIGPANSLVFYLAIPAMVFSAIAKASLTAHFKLGTLIVTLSMVVLGCVVAWVLGKVYQLKQDRLGSFVQTSFHGNLGYIGLAVTFYYLGEAGLVKASILTGFLMILQNMLAVLSLTIHASQNGSARYGLPILRNLAGNPVVISAMAGIFCSLFRISVPQILQRSLDILSGLALPMALLIIGASISFEKIKTTIKPVLSASVVKLIVMPGVGYACFTMLGYAAEEYLPGLILLASPTATVSYVMAEEMGGDSDFAVIMISMSTLLSSLTYAFWLNVAG